jgi:hypothetical protein
MSTIDGYSIATLVLFLLSNLFVINPISFELPLHQIPGPIVLTLDLNSAPIIVIGILWASGSIGAAQIRDGIIGTG